MAVHDAAAQEVIDLLRELIPGGWNAPGKALYTNVTEAQGDQIALWLAERGGYSLFVELDERPGQFDPNYRSTDWHWKLRQARNGCTQFFDILNNTTTP